MQNGGAKVYATGRQIVVESANGNDLPEVRVYDVVGRLLESSLSTNASRQPVYRFIAPATGAYMVKIGDWPARKVLVVR